MDSNTPATATSSAAGPSSTSAVTGNIAVKRTAKQGVYYGDYLQLDKILAAQNMESAKKGRPAHDEMLFIITHQTYELWFKQVLFEFSSIMKLFEEGPANFDHSLHTISHRMDRVLKIQAIMIQQVGVIETITPEDFLDFRNDLIPASGFQSYQFRLMENLLGIDSHRTFNNSPVYEHLRDDHKKLFLDSLSAKPFIFYVDEWLARMPFLEMGSFNFWNAYKDAATKMLNADEAQINGNPLLSAEDKEEELKALTTTRESFETVFDADKHAVFLQQGRRRLSHKATLAALFIHLYPEEPVLQLPFRFLQQLVDFDANLSLWRYRHMGMAMRMIGTKIGTGGSTGQGYLQKTTRQESYRVFNDLTNMSTYLLPARARPQLPDHVLAKLRFPPPRAQ